MQSDASLGTPSAPQPRLSPSLPPANDVPPPLGDSSGPKASD